ncbi:uncharacterized protein AMSG_05636 [Thecamonas trahens ATCC 50062]|uniref:Tyrosine-protein kinase ephrin type A/B receptor-like domain-containing protein n=1 Tax=Thecamonas trahens ATCC 50062 TaxID=461836 RepID=A0A0L0DC00_THETB|nr:hypothetical protein AMSG_05636 [Thecamonas trahens ATCC 50062]KNC49596.1 hypothetical protein AMSG_05636 [Thecamonas trahens ATCC 50062]|eukprot:XP_013757704.1 hypothetical protein AMSG_05636 [Thecamonas trahens ATCC 50062]
MDSLVADTDMLVVGAPDVDAVFLYPLTDGAASPLVQPASLSGPPASGFGSSAVLGSAMIAIGAPNGSPSHIGGEVHVYARTGAVAGVFLGIVAPDEAYVGLVGIAGLEFGASLAWSEPIGMLAIGLPGYNPGSTPGAGGVVVVSSAAGPGGSWAPASVVASPVLVAPSSASRTGGRTGAAVAWLSSAGRAVVFVGEPGDGAGALPTNAGRVHAFFANNPASAAAFSQPAYLAAFSPPTYSTRCRIATAPSTAGSRFGASLAAGPSGVLVVGSPGVATTCVFRPASDPASSPFASMVDVSSLELPSGAPGDASSTFGAAGLLARKDVVFVGTPSATRTAPTVAAAAGMVFAYHIPGMTDYDAALPVTATVLEILAPVGASAPSASFGAALASGPLAASHMYVSAPGLPSMANEANSGGVLPVRTRYCLAGQYVTDTECLPCPAGDFRPSLSYAGTCLPCPIGSYANAASGATRCEECPRGTFRDTAGGALVDACTPCPLGMYVNATGEASCLLCQSGSYADTEGSSTCAACPVGGDCRALGVGIPQALPGYWRDTSASGYVFTQCQAPSSRCAGRNQCAANWVNPPLCSDCAQGYFLKQDYTSDPQCAKCPKFIMAYVAGIIIIVLSVSVTLVNLARSATVFMTSIGVGLNFIQIAAVLSTFDAGWPQQTQKSLNYLTLFNLNLELFSIECVQSTGLSVAGKLMVKLALPLLFLLIFLIMYCVVKIFYKCRLSSVAEGSGTQSVASGAHTVAVASTSQFRSRSLLKNAKTWEWAVVNASLSMLNLIYISITLTCMEVFDCEDEDGDGVFRMRSQPDVNCYTAQWRKIRLYALVGGGVYGLGIPMLFFFLLKSRSSKLHRRSAVLQLGLLYRKYTKYSYLWELVIILRKIVVVGVKLFSSQFSEVTRMQIVFLAMTFFFLLQWVLKPYQSRRANRLELFTLFCVIGVLLCGLFFQKALGMTPSTTERFLVGYVVLGIVGAALIAIGFVIGYDFRNARRMKKRGMVGAYATEDVQVYPHFFRSGLRMASECRMVTTTDHFSNLMVSYTYDVYTRTPRPRIEVRGAARNRFGNVRSSYFDGRVQIQHDATENLYIASALFPHPGNYVLRFAGGVPLEPPSGCCTRRLTDRAREERESLWHPKRILMDYALVVTEAAATGDQQQFTDLERLRGRNGLLFSPVEQYLVAGAVFFRIKIPHAHGVVVLQDEGASETHLIKEKRASYSADTFHADTYSGDVALVPGRVTVVAFMRDDTLEAAMSSSHGGGRRRRQRASGTGGELQDIQLLEYVAVEGGTGVQSPSGGTVDARHGRGRRRNTVTGGIAAPHPSHGAAGATTALAAYDFLDEERPVSYYDEDAGVGLDTVDVTMLGYADFSSS